MTTALLLVDVQRNMLEGATPVPGAGAVQAALQSLLAGARESGAVVVHVQNDGEAGDPDEPHSAGWELVLPAAAGELVVRKGRSDTFAANPDLGASLRARDVRRVVVAGMQSNYCVAATSRGALRLGFDVVVASGAHATYDEGDGESGRAAAISAQVEVALAAEGVSVLSVREVDWA